MKRGLRQLPVLAALGALFFYVVTLSHGLTLSNLPLTAKLAGWDVQPLVGQPLLWLITLPLRLLPSGWVPMSLNLLAAVFASLTLGLLLRCLELMPWSRPLNTLKGWQRALPSLLAVAVCGLEFHFWQSATSDPGETLDGLLFALPIWCLLEFREGVRRSVFEERWVQAAVFCWGLGMAQNWMMLCALPVFLVGLFACHPLGLIERPLLLRLGVLGLAGFSLYALTPLVNGLWPGSPWSLGESWLISLKQTKQLLGGVWIQLGWAHRLVGLAMLVFYLVPGLAILARLQDENTSGKLPLDQIQIWLFRALRVGLLGLCLWLALNPVIGPREILREQMNLGLPLLSFDFLNGLAAGFLAGSLLLMRRPPPEPGDLPPFDPFELRAIAWLEHTVLPLGVAVTLLLSGLLLFRNAPAIRASQQRPLEQFGELALRSLPPGGGILLAGTPEKLWAFQAAQARHPEARDWLPVHFPALSQPDYRAQLERRLPGPWLAGTNQSVLPTIGVIQILDSLVRTNRVFFLQPGFDPAFEAFYLEPAGLISELKPFLTNTVNAPLLTPAQCAQNEQLWAELRPPMEAVAQAHPIRPPSRKKTLEQHLKLSPVPADQDHLLGEWYSMACNTWGVALQRAGQLTNAQTCLADALKLNPDNWIARANLFCNTNLQAGNQMSLAELNTLASGLGSMFNFTPTLDRLGPVDETACCFLLGNQCARAGLLRLAMQQFERAAALSPGVPAPQFALARLYLRCRLFEQARTTLARLRAAAARRPGTVTSLTAEISFLEAELCFAQNDPAGGRAALTQLVQEQPQNPALLERIVQALMTMRDPAGAEALVAAQLARRPDDVPLLLTRAGLLVQAGQAGQALPVLDHLIELTNLPPARLNRAIAYLQLSNFPAAKADFLSLTNAGLNPFTIHFGLAEIARHEGDTNQAITHLRQCVISAPPGSPQEQQARARLAALTGSTP